MGRRVENAALLMGLLHDVGKATPWFQDRVRGRTQVKDRRSHHARLGAIIANHVVDRFQAEDREKVWLRYAVVTGIARHHGNLNRSPLNTLKELRQEFRTERVYGEQLESMDLEGVSSWLTGQLEDRGIGFRPISLSVKGVADSLRNVSPLFDEPFNEMEDGLDFLAAFGLMLGADKMHAALPGWKPARYGVKPEVVTAFKRKCFGQPKGVVDETREEVFSEIQETLDASPHGNFYTITAPTGSGKTLAGFAAGLFLKHRKEANGPSRLVYCLPFTSIIDQNSDVYRNVLETGGYRVESELLLTHHHLSDLSYRVGGEDVDDGADLLVETWQSEIVVTTFHQFLYTFLTSKNSNLKRIASLKNAVVLLDEVQAIPHRYWEDIRKLFRYVAERFDTAFILMTATMPLILSRNEATELLPSYASRFNALSRTRIVNQVDHPLRLDDLEEALLTEIAKEPDYSRIVLLNRRKPVRELYRSLSSSHSNVHMLSTDLTPLDRRRILDGLRSPFILVTTQVVEAGVDISAHEVWRDIAPLDAIIQSAGRCNRHGEASLGNVHLVQLVDDHGRMAVPPYDGFLVETTLDALSQQEAIITEDRFHELAQAYYALLKERSQPAKIHEILAKGDVHNVNDPHKGFVLIKDIPRQSYFIIQDDHDAEIWKAYNSLYEIKDFFERRKRFRKMRKSFMDRIVQQLTQNPSSEIIPIYRDDDRYSPVTGLEDADAGHEII